MFARYILRKRLKTKYGTNQIREIWKEFQFKRYGGKIEKLPQEKGKYINPFEAMTSFMKNMFKKKVRV